MARKPVVLVTGASGEMGHGLIHRLAELGTFDVLALDVRALDPELARRCAAVRVGDILDRHVLDRLRNVSAFSPRAGELADLVRAAFPAETITFTPDPRRQAIVDSWPEDVDDARARRDWGFRPAYDLGRAFTEYLLPNVRRGYAAP